MRGNFSLCFRVCLGPSSQPAGITNSGNHKNSGAVARELHFSKPLDDSICKNQLAGTARERQRDRQTRSCWCVCDRELCAFSVRICAFSCLSSLHGYPRAEISGLHNLITNFAQIQKAQFHRLISNEAAGCLRLCSCGVIRSYKSTLGINARRSYFRVVKGFVFARLVDMTNCLVWEPSECMFGVYEVLNWGRPVYELVVAGLVGGWKWRRKRLRGVEGYRWELIPLCRDGSVRCASTLLLSPEQIPMRSESWWSQLDQVFAFSLLPHT